MHGFVGNIEEESITNENFRKVLYTSCYSQLVVMSLAPGEDIGEEIHGLDQFIRIEDGEGIAVLDEVEYRIEDDFAILIPAGTRHNIINTSASEPLKLYTLYAPPNHKDGTIHASKSDATEEEFDGSTTE